MMMQAKRQTLMLAVTVTVTVALTGAKDQLLGRFEAARRDGERGAAALEWAIIAAIAVAIVAVVGAKVSAAVDAHSAKIK